MSDIDSHSEVEIGSERHFGFVFFAVFLLLSGFGLVFGYWYWPITACLAILLVVLAVLFPNALRVPNRIWFRFGKLLHSIISPVVMFLVFAVTFVPIGLIFRILGKDLLEQDFDPEKASYWVDRSAPPGEMTRQF